LAAGDELVEEVDATGRVVRVVTRRRMRAENLRHRNVAVVVRRPDGAIVVHQRAEWKDVHPSRWDVAFGGVPAVGEDDLVAAVRELAEEAGLRVDASELTELGTATASDEHTRWVGRFYSLTTDAALHPADGEVARMVEVPFGELAGWAEHVALCPDVHPLLAMVLDEFG
jgi:8-oxo-dGTP pyrophosphatase MutT (NUDIX family)